MVVVDFRKQTKIFGQANLEGKAYIVQQTNKIRFWKKFKFIQIKKTLCTMNATMVLSLWTFVNYEKKDR